MAQKGSEEVRERILVSLKTLAGMLDCHRETVRRWLRRDGIRPVVLSDGPKGAIRYWWKDILPWLESLQEVE